MGQQAWNERLNCSPLGTVNNLQSTDTMAALWLRADSLGVFQRTEVTGQEVPG